MALLQDLTSLIQAIRGVSTYAPPEAPGPELGSPAVDAARRALGGNLEPIPVVRTRWYQKDIERATLAASNGNLMLIGQLNESMKDFQSKFRKGMPIDHKYMDMSTKIYKAAFSMWLKKV